MILDDWKKTGKYFNYDNHNIFYKDAGEGEVLVCIHGFPTASWDWHRLWPKLTERFRVLAVDMLGFGFSDKPKDHTYSIHDWATLHESLLQTLGIWRIHILAHDCGNTVAQELLARSEDRQKARAEGIEIRSVCFLNGGLFPETIRPRLIQKLLMSPLGSLVGRFISERSLHKNFSAIFGKNTQPTDKEIKDFWSLITYNQGVRVSHRIIRYMNERKIYRARWVGVLQTAKVSLRHINGTSDPINGLPMANRYRELVPSADVVLLENIGHYPQIEDPVRVIEAFFVFIDK
jgi:pimeloyl-ACP methyl ester carboxylesterase